MILIHKFQGLNDDELYCYQALTKVSRSFSAVILELTPELRKPICVFYLVLRGLDTIGSRLIIIMPIHVEDDMTIHVEKKVRLLKEFGEHLEQKGWNSREGCKEYSKK